VKVATSVICGLFIALAAVAFANPSVSGAKQSLPLNARGLVVPFYCGNERQPSLVAKLDRVTNERQRKAFFRIGVLPLIVGHDIVLEVQHPENFINVRQQFHQHLAGKDLKKAVELRGFTLSVPNAQATLTAQRVRLLSPDTWELNGQVTLVTPAGTNIFSQVMLTTDGAAAGQLRNASGPLANLFSPTSP